MNYTEYKRDILLSKILNKEISEDKKPMYRFLNRIDNVREYKINIRRDENDKIFAYKFMDLEIFNIVISGSDSVVRNINLHHGFIISVFYEINTHTDTFFEYRNKLDNFMLDFIKDKFGYEIGKKYNEL